MNRLILFFYLIYFTIQSYAQNNVEDSLLNEAKFFYYTFAFDSAENCIEQLLRINPYSAKAYDVYGDIYRKNQKFSKALEMYKKSSSIDSTDLNVIRHIATANIDLGNLNQAIKILTDLIQRDSTIADFYVDIGDAFNKSGDTSQAIYYFSKAVNMNSHHALARDNLGAMYSTISQWDKGIDEFLYILLNDWYPIEIKIKFSSVMAESKFRSWVEQQPTEAEAHYYYSFSLLYKYGTDDALTEIEKAIELNSQNEKYHLAKAFFLYIEKEYEEVIYELEKFLMLNPNDWMFKTFLAQSYMQLGNTSAAFNYAKQSVEIDSLEFSTYLVLGILYNKNKEFCSAIKCLNKAFSLHPNVYNPKLYYELAFAHYYLDDYKRAWGYAMAANKIYSVCGRQTFLDGNFQDEINTLIAQIWQDMD